METATEGLGCLDTEGRATDDGTAVVIAPCADTYEDTQDWHYDRAQRRIYNPSLDRCLDIRAGEIGDYIPTQVWPCMEVDAQRFWFDSETKRVASALGTNLGNLLTESANYLVAGTEAQYARLVN